MKKLLFAITIILLTMPLFSEDMSKEYDNAVSVMDEVLRARRIVFGNIQYLDAPLSDLSLALLSKQELWILRNTIFARYGYIFQSTILTDVFSEYDWYKPEYTNVDDFLTETDKINIDHIKQYENIERDEFLTENPMEGYEEEGWNKTQVVAAGYDDHFIFHSGDRVEFGFSQMIMKLLSWYEGNYKITKNAIRIEVDKLHFDFSEVGINTKEYRFWETPDDRIGRKSYINNLTLEQPLVLYFPFEKPERIDFHGYDLSKIVVGTTEYYIWNR